MPSKEEVRLAGALTDRCLTAYMRAVQETLTGDGAYWTESTDEQWDRVFCAVRRALSGIGLTDAERWDIVMQAVIEGASEYASEKAREQEP